MFDYVFTFFLVCGIQDGSSLLSTGDDQDHQGRVSFDHEKCGITNLDRIIGGKNAKLGMYPWIARIGYRSNANSIDRGNLSYRCGGTLINRFHIVTAAHCVANLPGRFDVAGIRLGEFNTKTNPDCEKGYCADEVQDFLPAAVIVHEKYNEPAFKNDIALIRLDKPAFINEYVMPICIPSEVQSSMKFTGRIAEVAGWGIYDINDPQSSVLLQTIKLPILETERCVKPFRQHAQVGDEQMCVGGIIGEDSCGGDSGGPLMIVESFVGSPKYYIIGLVSFGAKHCGQSTTPAVYTRISSYRNWIVQNIQF